MDNVQNAEKVPQSTQTPALWLIRNDASARRLRLDGDTLRTVVGIDTVFTHRVDELRIPDIRRIEMVAPYAPPSPKISLILFGAAIGVVCGTGLAHVQGIIAAIATTAFALVALIMRGATTARQRLLRLEMTDGRTVVLSCDVEGMEEARGLLGEDRWVAGVDDDRSHSLKPDERYHVERMRIGLVLGGSGAALGMLYLAANPAPGLHYAIAIPTNIFYLATAGIVACVMGLAWWKMVVAPWVNRTKGRRP